MDTTQRTILDLNNQFPNSPAIAQLNEHPVIRRIWQALPGNNTNELTVGEATEALSHVRGVVRNLSAKNDASGPILRRVSALEQAIEGDVMIAAQRADLAAGRLPGSPGSATQAQRQADAFWARKKMVTGRGLKTAMRSGQDDLTVSGSTVFNQLVGDMSAKGGNMRRLTTAWQNLPQGARRSFSATAFDQLGRATSSQQNAEGSAWSFQTFMTNWNNMHPAARNMVFGGRGADQQIQDIATYASRLRDIDRMRNFPNTARNILMGSFLTVVGGALWKGDIGTAAAMTAALPAAHGFASAMMATPAMRQWTRTTLQSMTTGNQRSLLAQTNRLQAIAAREPAFAQQILGLRQALVSAANDNVGRAGPLAASPDQRPNQPNQ